MSDKFRKTYPLKITFGQGEQATGPKLTAISEQTRNGLSLIERAIGDPWSQSGDSLLIDSPIWIPNLARQLGQNQFMSLALPPPDEDFYFTESVGLKHIGKTTGHLLFKPKSPLDFLSASGGLSLVPNRQTDENDVDRTGRWWVDPETGRFRTYDALTGTEKVTYRISPDDDWLAGDETLPGIIPDPGQAEFTACKISTDGSKYFIHLPPRRPLTLSDRELPHTYPSTAAPDERPDNEADVVPGGGIGQPGHDGYLMWQNGTTAITGVDAAHYRYDFPKEIKDAIIAGDLVGGDEVPQGILGLWDDDEKTWIDDVIFKIPASLSERYILEVSSDRFDFSTVVSATETEADYSDTNLILITCGSPVARMIWTMMNMLLKHQHHGSGSLEAPTSHTYLDDANPPDNNYSFHPGTYPSYLPAWAPSNWAHDPHTSLLSRAGSSATAPRDKNNNAMLGHLVLADQDETGTPPTFLDSTPNNTFRLYFGDIGGPSLYATSGDGVIFDTKLHPVASSNAWLTNEGTAVKVEGPDDIIFTIKNENQAQVWDFSVEDSPWDSNETFSITRHGGNSIFHITPDDSVWLGESPDIGQPGVPLVISTTDVNHIQLRAAGPGSQVMSVHAGSSSNGWISCATDFNDSGNEGGELNLGGQDGVNLRYGNAGSGPFISNQGTVGVYMDNSGDFHCNQDLYVNGDTEFDGNIYVWNDYDLNIDSFGKINMGFGLTTAAQLNIDIGLNREYINLYGYNFFIDSGNHLEVRASTTTILDLTGSQFTCSPNADFYNGLDVVSGNLNVGDFFTVKGSSVSHPTPSALTFGTQTVRRHVYISPVGGCPATADDHGHCSVTSGTLKYVIPTGGVGGNTIYWTMPVTFPGKMVEIHYFVYFPFTPTSGQIYLQGGGQVVDGSASAGNWSEVMSPRTSGLIHHVESYTGSFTDNDGTDPADGRTYRLSVYNSTDQDLWVYGFTLVYDMGDVSGEDALLPIYNISV